MCSANVLNVCELGIASKHTFSRHSKQCASLESTCHLSRVCHPTGCTTRIHFKRTQACQLVTCSRKAKRNHAKGQTFEVEQQWTRQDSGHKHVAVPAELMCHVFNVHEIKQSLQIQTGKRSMLRDSSRCQRQGREQCMVCLVLLLTSSNWLLQGSLKFAYTNRINAVCQLCP